MNLRGGPRWLAALSALLPGLVLPAPAAPTPMQLSVTVDFPDDLTQGPFDAARLDLMMAALRELGVRRVNWNYYGEVAPADLRQGNIWWAHWATYGPATIASLGEPLRAAVRSAHAHGLEIYGVLKPYNGGLSGSYPSGSPEAGSTSRLTKLGGTLQQVIPFLELHPELRLQHRPDPPPAAGPVREIRLIKADAGVTRLRPEQIRIWTSPNNYQYRPLALVPHGTVRLERSHADVRDYHGNLLTRRGDPVRVVCLEGLDLRAPFIVLTTTCTGGAGDFRNTPLAMLEVRGERGVPLEVAVATHAALWIRPRDFRSYGLEFDMGYGHLPITLDTPWTGAAGDPWKPFAGRDEFAEEALFGKGPAGGFLGFTQGRNEYLPAAPCEAYPEVRQLWLAWIEAMLADGVDGVSLRVSAHGCLSDTPAVYGWNPPVLAAYRQRFGDGPVEPAKLAQVRGDFYSAFVRDAAAQVRARGKKLQVHLHAEAFRPDPVFGQQNGVPANIEFQWQRWLESGWVDEIYLRTSWFEAAEDPLGGGAQRSRLPAVLADPVVTTMLGAAARRHLPVTLNRYVGRAASLPEYLDDLALAERDGRFAAFDIYEFFDLAQSSPTGPGLQPKLGRLAALKACWEALQAEAPAHPPNDRRGDPP